VVPQPEPHSGENLGMAVAAVLLLPACHPQANRILLSGSDDGRTVAAEVGKEVIVSLDAIGPFYFGTPSVSSASIRFVGESDQFPSPPNPGGGKTQRYTFEAAAVGRAAITIPRQLPVPEPPVFAITVQVY
jgi:hypothetical protein